MIKQIEIIGYNTVEIKKRYESGDCLCDVKLIETVEQEGQEPTKVVKASDTDLIFTSKQLKLTKSEIETLNPTPKQ